MSTTPRVVRRAAHEGSPSDVQWAIGQSIRLQRELAGISQQELAVRLRDEVGAKILRDGINDLENGRRAMRPVLLLGLSKVLGVPVVDLLAGPDTDDDLEVFGHEMTMADYSRWIRGQQDFHGRAVRRTDSMGAFEERLSQLEARLSALEATNDDVPAREHGRTE